MYTQAHSVNKTRENGTWFGRSPNPLDGWDELENAFTRIPANAITVNTTVIPPMKIRQLKHIFLLRG